MYIDDLIWLPDIVEKLLWKHHVTQEEVEEVLDNKPQFRFVEKGFRTGEDVYAALSQTDSGRYLIVLFINKPNHLALIVSARDMDAKERRHYEHR